jgi:competence CoiA-like predicted nuclease
MQFGVDENNLRIIPTFSGQKTKCPLCGGILIGKCGDIYTWHWQHTNNRECDPWKEHETQWHRNWKSRFPEEQREIIIINENEKHIADVRTSKGMVIEFQNSSISTDTIRIREQFYDNIIWIINAGSFSHNINKFSAVKSKLRQFENDSTYSINLIAKHYTDSIEELNKELNRISTKKEANEEYFYNKYTESEELKDYTFQIDLLFNSIIQAIKSRRFNAILNKFGFDIKEIIERNLSEINKLTIENKEKLEFIDKIKGLESYIIGNTVYKLVQYELISANSFHITKAILKTTSKSLFPEILSFESAFEFKTFNVKAKLYDFAIDLTEKVKKNELDIIGNKERIDKLNNSIKEIISTTLDVCILDIENEAENLRKANEELTIEYDVLYARLEKIIKLKYKEVLEYEEEIEKEKKEKRFKIMKENKGLYYFDWKHERKSWQVSIKPIYFDIGEDYLLEKLRDGLFQKISIVDFLKIHK